MHLRSVAILTLLLGMGLLLCISGCASPPRKSVFTGDAQTPAASPPDSDAPASARTPGQESSTLGNPQLVRAAEGYLGTPYRFGGASSSGMDCSGLVQTVFAEEGIPLPRSCAAQARQGVPVSRDQLRQGDLVFFGSAASPPSHVGIYSGKGRFIHASTSKGKVRRDELSTAWFRDHYRGARRVPFPQNTLSSNQE